MRTTIAVLLSVLIIEVFGQVFPPQIQGECQNTGMNRRGTCPEGQTCEYDTSHCHNTPARLRRQLMPPLPGGSPFSTCTPKMKCLPDLDECLPPGPAGLPNVSNKPPCPQGQKCEMTSSCTGPAISVFGCRYYSKCVIDRDECSLFDGQNDKQCVPGQICRPQRPAECTGQPRAPPGSCNFYNKCVEDKNQCSPFDQYSTKKCAAGQRCEQRPDPNCDQSHSTFQIGVSRQTMGRQCEFYFQCIVDKNECGWGFGVNQKPPCPNGEACRSAMKSCSGGSYCDSKLVCFAMPNPNAQCSIMPPPFVTNGNSAIQSPMSPQANSMFGRRRKRQFIPMPNTSFGCKQSGSQCKVIKIDLPDSYSITTQTCVPDGARPCTGRGSCNATEKCVEVSDCYGCPSEKKCVQV